MILQVLVMVILEAMLQPVGEGGCMVQGSIVFACPSSCNYRGRGEGGSDLVDSDRAMAVRAGMT